MSNSLKQHSSTLQDALGVIPSIVSKSKPFKESPIKVPTSVPTSVTTYPTKPNPSKLYPKPPSKNPPATTTWQELFVMQTEKRILPPQDPTSAAKNQNTKASSLITRRVWHRSYNIQDR